MKRDAQTLWERQIAEEMLRYIEKSPSCFHAVENGKVMLEESGFQELAENEEWKLLQGGRYFVVRGDSTMIAFQLPEDITNIKGFHMVSTHSDSPTFKVKETPEICVEEHYVKLNTEKYGGMIHSTWMDRVLSVAGRIAVQEKKDGEPDKIVTKLVNVEEDLLIIPNLAIHMNRDVNKGVEYNPQVDLLPLMAGGAGDTKGMLLRKVAQTAGVAVEDILGHDLFLYPREKGRILGAGEEFVCSPRLDDLQCTFAALKAMAESKPAEYINVFALFNHEEVGSGTAQGADSTILADVLWRICDGLGKDRNAWLRWITDGFMISADNAHAVHPNHPEKADPTNRPYLNGGVVIKYHGGQKYATDAVSSARLKQLCAMAGVPVQTFANRSDQMGGSTLGNISTSHVSVSTADIGLPQLAMHSAVETAGVKDTAYALELFKTFWKE